MQLNKRKGNKMNKTIVCPHCHKEINQDVVADGVWYFFANRTNGYYFANKPMSMCDGMGSETTPFEFVAIQQNWLDQQNDQDMESILFMENLDELKNHKNMIIGEMPNHSAHDQAYYKINFMEKTIERVD